MEHAVSSIVGRFEQLGPLGAVRPVDTRVRADFFVLPGDGSPALLGVGDGDMVAARILTYPNREESGVVTLERRIGKSDASELGIECIMARWGLEDGYAQAGEDEAEGLALDVAPALADPLRRDERDRFCLTIDPVDARDFDDAISVERAQDGGWRLGVHIADVSHYVAWDGHIDMEARRRATSVYLADRVLPMLPERLSNNLCSLVPGEDRLAMTVDMELDGRGRVRGYRAYPSAIRSRVRLDYAAADAVLEGRLDKLDDDVREGEGADAELDAARRGAAAVEAASAFGVDLAAFLGAADDLAHARQRLRAARGAIDFNTVEVHALLDQAGMPQRIITRRRSAATSLIEEAMLLANECVAEYLSDRGIATAYRVHEWPAPDNLAAAARVLRELGVLDAAQAACVEAGDPRAIAHAVEAAADTPWEPVANALLLRAMQRALYKPANEGHYALGASAYCHFTSPIRRYPDLLVHRQLKLSLASERLGKREAASRAVHLAGAGPQSLERLLPQLCRHANERERIADAAASSSQKVKVAQYYAARTGERACGEVCWMSDMGLFVRLDDTGAEGLVRLRDLGQQTHEWWELDERALRLVGTATGRVVALGCRVVVEVGSCDVVRGHVNLSLIHAGWE